MSTAAPVSIAQRELWPYYKEHIAISIKPMIDSMLADGTMRKVYAAPLGIGVVSLEKYLSQGSHYIIDHYDPTGVYSVWRKSVSFKRKDHDPRIPTTSPAYIKPGEGYVWIKWKVLNPQGILSTIAANSVTPLRIGKATLLTKPVVDEERAPNRSKEWKPDFELFIEGEGKAVMGIGEVTLSAEDIGYVKAVIAGVGGIRIVKLDSNNIIIERE